MSPTDSQPKESTPSSKPDPSTRRLPVQRQSPSIVARLVNGVADVRDLGWAFVETLLSASHTRSRVNRLDEREEADLKTNA